MHSDIYSVGILTSWSNFINIGNKNALLERIWPHYRCFVRGRMDSQLRDNRFTNLRVTILNEGEENVNNGLCFCSISIPKNSRITSNFFWLEIGYTL